MRTSTWWIIIIVLLLIILGLAWMLFMTPAPGSTTLNATSTVATTTTGTGGTSTSTATTTAQTTPIVTSPASGGTVQKSFSVTGQAPNNWFFEAVFPIEVRNASGTVVATGHANAQTDWMTPGMVAFTANISVAQYSGPATLVLKKDNPSGLPQNDGSFSIPITIQ